MEPSSVLQYNQDTLQELQGELDTLSALMNKATNDASASSSELTSQLNDLTGRVSWLYCSTLEGSIWPTMPPPSLRALTVP